MADNKGIFGKLYDLANASIDARLDALQKIEEVVGAPVDGQAEGLFKGEKRDGTVGRKGLLFDPFFDNSYSAGMFKPKSTYMSPVVLKQVSRKNTLVAALIDVRASQVSAACRKQTSRFDIGFKIQPKDHTQTADQDEVRKIEEFILNCGYTNDRTPEDKMTFEQWGYMVARDWMTVGHAAIELVNRRDGDLHSFLPLPAETIYYANKKMDAKTIAGMRDTYRSVADPDKLDVDKAAKGEYEFVQVIEGKVTEGFAHEELIFAKLNLESDIDLNGYCIGPLERGIAAIISHMQIENHQRQFFTHGAASKGLLVIQGDVAPSTLKTLQAQWTQQISGPFSAWRTPILAGIKGVQWVPLAASNRDMEYAAWQDYIIRVMCSAMGISTTEIGFDYLSKGTEQRSMGESSNEWKLEASRDRGLRPILGRIEAILNEEVMPAFNKEFSKKYHFCFVGLDAETRQEEVERMQAEVSLHTSINEIRKQAEMKPLAVGGDLILNPVLLQTLSMNMFKGDFMEKFLGIPGASQRPDLQYIPDPMWFQWQQLQMQMMAPQGTPAVDENGNPVDPSQMGGQPGAEGQPGMEDQGQEQQLMADQQQDAVQQYMQANPELFKHHKANLEHAENLRKAEQVNRKINVQHVEDMTEALVKDFRKAGDALMKEIFDIVQEDLKDQGKKK